MYLIVSTYYVLIKQGFIVCSEHKYYEPITYCYTYVYKYLYVYSFGEFFMGRLPYDSCFNCPWARPYTCILV